MEMPPIPGSLCNLAAEGEMQVFLSEARAWGESCARMAREECAKLVETTPAEAYCTVMHQAQLQKAREVFAAAIRKG